MNKLDFSLVQNLVRWSFSKLSAPSLGASLLVRNNRKLQDGRTVKQLYRHGKRGQQILLEGLTKPLTISWFWLKRADSKRELRFVVSSHPYSGAYLVMLDVSVGRLMVLKKPSIIVLVCIVLGSLQNLAFFVGWFYLWLLIFWLTGALNGRFLLSWTGNMPLI